MVGLTALDRFKRSCNAYVAIGAQFDGRTNGTAILAGGPEAGLMCQLGNVMLQVAPTVTGNIFIAEPIALNSENHKNTGYGGRARLLVGNRLYVSADATVQPSKESEDSEVRHGSLNAQLRADGWVFMGTIRHLDVRKNVPEPGGNFQSTEGTLSVGRAW